MSWSIIDQSLSDTLENIIEQYSRIIFKIPGEHSSENIQGKVSYCLKYNANWLFHFIRQKIKNIFFAYFAYAPSLSDIKYICHISRRFDNI